MVKNPRSCLVDIARAELNVRETSKNQGPGIEKYWGDTSYLHGYRDRQPYCAAFLCYVVAEAMRREFNLGLTATTRPRSASVLGWHSWAAQASSGVLVFYANDEDHRPQHGDIVSFLPKLSHIGLVETSPENGYIGTIEGNTDGAGGRDGDGVYRRTRALSFCGRFFRLAWRAA